MIPITPKLDKIIEAKQVFADLAYKEYRASRYGMTFCCPKDFNSHSTFNEICNWEDNSKTLYDVSTATYTTWNHVNHLTNGGSVPTWVQTVRTPYSALRYNLGDPNHIIDATAPGGAGGEQIITIGNTSLNAMVTANGLIRGQSMIHALVMQDWNAAGVVTSVGPTVLSQAFIDLINNRAPIGTNNLTSFFTGVITQPEYFNLFWKPDIKWIRCNPGGTVIPAAGNVSLPINFNTNAQNQGKNGARSGDFVWFLITINGDFNTVTPNGEYDLTGDSSKILRVNDSNTGTKYKLSTSADFMVNKLDQTDASYMFAGHISSDINLPSASGGLTLGYQVRAYTAYPGTSINTVPNNTASDAPIKGMDAGYTLCDDRETLYINVVDKDGNNVKDYDIIIDNTHYGKTDASGIIRVTIQNASKDTKHMINGCECFTTTGACNQQKITITLKDSTKPSCTNLAIDCL